jgi:hypothetical protein
MKKILFLLLIAIAIVPVYVSAVIPVISPAPNHPDADENGDVWYYIQFLDILDLVVLDAELADDWGATPAFPVKDEAKQQWKLTLAETEGSVNYYSLVNKTGLPLLYYSRYFRIEAIEGQTQVAVFSIEELSGGAVRLYRKGQEASGRTITRSDPEFQEYPIGGGACIYEQVSSDSLRFVLPKDIVYPSAYFSTEADPKWYYIQFAKSGKVIQDNGENLRLTAEVGVKDNNAQLWRIAYNEDYTYAPALPGKGLYNGTYSIVNKRTGNKIFYLGASGTGVPVDGDGFYSLSGSADYSVAPRKCDITISGTAKFAPSETLTGAYPGFFIRGNWNNTSASVLLDYNVSANAENKLVKTTVGDEASLHFVSTLESPSAISAIAAERFGVYPNPAEDYIKVELPDGATTISILDTTGRTVTKINPSTSVVNIPVSNLAPGLYIVKIEKASDVKTVKFIKN